MLIIITQQTYSKNILFIIVFFLCFGISFFPSKCFSALDIHNDFDLFLANKAAEWIKENDFENLPPVPEII